MTPELEARLLMATRLDPEASAWIVAAIAKERAKEAQARATAAINKARRRGGVLRALAALGEAEVCANEPPTLLKLVLELIATRGPEEFGMENEPDVRTIRATIGELKAMDKTARHALLGQSPCGMLTAPTPNRTPT